MRTDDPNQKSTEQSSPLPIEGRERASMYPPGLRYNLPLYLAKRFFRPHNPILLFEHLARTFGSAASYRMLNQHIVFLNEPDLVRQVLIDKAASFHKERVQKRMKILLGEGLLTSDGEIHKRQRRIAAPAFHRQRIEAYGRSMAQLAERRANQWKAGMTLNVHEEMMQLSLEVVARTIFSTDVTEDIQQINHEVNAVMGLYNLLVIMPKVEQMLNWPVPGIRRFRIARERLDGVVARMIAQRRSAGAQESTQGDLMTMLMQARDEESDDAASSGMSDEQLIDEILTIFLAGYETVANALTWTWYLLGQNPAVEARFHQEIDRALNGHLPTLEDLPKLEYVERVFAESMRLYPPAWAMGRQATTDVDIGPYRLKAGTIVFFSQYVIQRDARYFDEPLRFNPERFTPEEKAKRPRFTYFPFGGGGRQCIGEGFAWMEGVLILATLGQRWKLQLLPGQKQALQPKITLRPRYPVMASVVPRN